MNFIFELLINAGVLFLLAAILPSVNIKNYGTAIGVALVIGILNATIGFLLRLPLNLITLGLLSFVVRLIVTALMIKLADKLFRGFEVKGWAAAFLLAVCMAIAGTILTNILHPAT
jgi:putative membrane protein